MNKILLSAVILLIAGSACGADKKTVITGENMEILSGGRRISFTGGAKVERGLNELTADTILQDKSKGIYEASGNVNFRAMTSDNDVLTGQGAKAVYAPDKEYGEIFGGRVKMSYVVKGAGEPVLTETDKIVYNKPLDSVRAIGRVRIMYSSGTALSDEADFIQSSREIILSGAGRPSISVKETEYEGSIVSDKMTLLPDRKKIRCEGNVKAVIVDLRKNQ